MKLSLHTLLVGLFFLCSTQLLQALHPAYYAPLHDHLVEVNQEWLHQAESLGELALPASFANDTERIQRHLWWVEKILRERTAELSLSPEQRQQRLALLDALRLYQEAGNFPQNTRHSYRIPYFIDTYGTPCAVGQLLITSGFEEVAERVRAEMNNAYVREIPFGELPAWAEAHGFSLAELAWIQPGYPPSTLWKAVGGTGANAPADVIIEDPADGSLLIFGAFTQFNGVACHGAVRVSESTTTALDTFPLSGAKTAVVYQGDIWVGGSFPGQMGNIYNLMRWDGSKWEQNYVGFGAVNCLHIHNGELYAGGDFLSSIYDNLAKYDTTSGWWAPFGSYLGSIDAICSYQNELVVGGSFVTNNPSQMSYISRWDGSQWQPLQTGGDTLDAPVKALFADGQKLYAGGEIANRDGGDHFGLARLEVASQGWDYLLPSYSTVFPIPSVDTTSFYISDIEVFESQVYVSGSFFTSFSLIEGTNFGVYDSSFGGFIDPMGVFNRPVADMLMSNKKLYATGDFTFPMGYVVETSDLASGLPNDLPFDKLTIFPNPAQDFVQLRWELPSPGMNIQLDVYDISGRKLPVRYEAGLRSIRLFRDQLPAGAYAFVLRDGEKALNRGRFIFR